MTPSPQGWTDLPLASLVLAGWNYKTNDDELAGKLRENMERNGQIETLLVRELGDGTFEVINGNHRLPVMVDLEMENAHCYNVGTVTDQQAMLLAVQLNETRFANDPLVLAARLTELDETFGREDLLATLPFTDFQLDSYQHMLEGVDWRTPITKDAPSAGTGGDGVDDGMMTCPGCNGVGRVPKPDDSE
jgi:hypothetical protein